MNSTILDIYRIVMRNLYEEEKSLKKFMEYAYCQKGCLVPNVQLQQGEFGAATWAFGTDFSAADFSNV